MMKKLGLKGFNKWKLTPGHPKKKAVVMAKEGEKTKLIRDAINQGTSQYGMQTFDQSLYLLYKNGLITLEEALRRATNPDEFKLKIQGIQSTSDISREEMDGVLELGTESDLDPFSEESPFEFGNDS